MEIEIEQKIETEYCTYDEFKKLDIRIGEIKVVELIPKSEKLLKCTISFGELGERTIVSGIIPLLESIDGLIGKKVLYLFNLAPRPLMGVESQGMLLAVGDDKETFSFLIPENVNVVAGARIK